MKIGKMEIKLLTLDDYYLEGKRINWIIVLMVK